MQGEKAGHGVTEVAEMEVGLPPEEDGIPRLRETTAAIADVPLDDFKAAEEPGLAEPTAPTLPAGVAGDLMPVDGSELRAGECLTPPEYTMYGSYTDFNRTMGAEATRLNEEMPAMAHSPESVKRQMREVAQVRMALEQGAAKDGKRRPNKKMGRPIAESEEEYGARTGENPYEMTERGRIFDVIDSSGRHKSFLEKATDYCHEFEGRNRHNFFRVPATDAWASIELEGKPTPLTQLFELDENLIYVLHPSHVQIKKIYDHAFVELSEAMNQWDDATEDSKNRIANAYRLLCHATPFENGTPSIVETVLDGFFRSKGLALPRKTSEPFWHALFWKDADGPYTWDKLMENYGGLGVPNLGRGGAGGA